MCVALALTPDGVCRCLPVSYLAHRLSDGLCLPSCRGLLLVPCPRLNQHPRTARSARNPAPARGLLRLCLLFKVMGELMGLQHGRLLPSFCVTSL